MSNVVRSRGGKGAGTKSSKNPGAASRKAIRDRNKARRPARKDAAVTKSSHSVFLSVAALERHRIEVTVNRHKARHTRPVITALAS